jgi:hypothetical protein
MMLWVTCSLSSSGILTLPSGGSVVLDLCAIMPNGDPNLLTSGRFTLPSGGIVLLLGGIDMPSGTYVHSLLIEFSNDHVNQCC